MRKLFSVSYTLTSVNLAALVLRLGFGILMINHGYGKLTNFAQYQPKFLDFLGLGTGTSLGLAIFAEFFCSILLVLGLFTRLATIPLIILSLVIIFVAHGADFFGEAEAGAHYLAAYVAILLLGPGDYSLDRVLNRNA
ncbi:DoxX family protein [Siphonobacter aquaeclarae]|jgi:putative oxidoreductase|uniref:Putative oxidoreductase n=1 Tax=Siphonobacter aquaeclarae TaxID=563176 RepID=A0A1G9PKX2_9BACT|nr:DoxX family protein [Siphonobacter aquaeclarae]MBO9638824.1 DoxX family protein [Siphonobacter aquaeclarae]SDL99364.1 putative oxidoreductase [Siphonobacter aquaeclarae]